MFSHDNLLLDSDDAVARMSHMLELLQAHIEVEAPSHLMLDWYEMTENLFDTVFENGGSTYFEQNSGFNFSHWVNRPRQLESVNVSRTEAFLKKVVRELQKATTNFDTPNKSSEEPEVSDIDVFVVHGQSELYLHDIARTLQNLGLQPIILREQPNRGSTIIEKFERHSSVGFAVILMTDDDLGGKKSAIDNNLKLQPRARQNVVLEMGYFIGKLGRSRVCVLKSISVEEPSDILGVVYTHLDDKGLWKYELVRELKAAGYAVSADAIA